MVRNRMPSPYVLTAMVALSILLLACGQGDGGGHADLVAFDALIAHPQQYAGQYVCTQGVHVDGSEASALAAPTYKRGGLPQRTEPVIWLEGADVRSREDCTRTDTQPSFEFCRAVACGVFETGGGYGHEGAYEHRLRGRDVAVLPSPTVTSAPLPTAPLDDKTASAPEPEGESPHVEPPPAILEIAGQEQVSGIGTYCWTQPTGEETAVSICADMAGIPTAEESLVVGSPFTATFRLAPTDAPYELFLEVTPVTAKDEFEEWPAGWRGWPFLPGERYRLPLERAPSLELSLEPGLYVLNLAGWWQAWGDASYGFLVEVTAGPQFLFSYNHDSATELWTIDPATGAVERQMRPDQTIQNPTLSPSGETVAYVRVTGDYGGVVSELWLMDRDGANPRPLYVPPAGQSVLSHPAWQPDGQEIYYLQLGSGATSQLLRFPVQGGEPTLVLTDCLGFSLSPDGTWLASVSLDRQLTLWRRDGIRLGDLDPQIDSFTDYASLVVSPAGDLIAFRATEQDEDTWNLYVMDRSGLNVRRLTDLRGFHPLTPSSGQVNGLAWTADQRHLVYSVDGDPEQSGLWLVGMEYGEPRRLFAWAEGEWAAVQGPWFQLSSPLPLLTVDESPIVAAGIDGPGHIEYTDRLGAQILTRVEGLRGRAAEQEQARTNAILARFGYRLESRFDPEWDRIFYDLFRQGSTEPLLAGLSHVWPPSVNASGTDFVLAAENAPNVFPLYLLVQASSVEPWAAGQSNWLPPVYAGDALARVTYTGFPTLTYQLELDNQVVYSGTAVALGAYMPLQGLTAWDGHWVLEADDHLIMDGQDLGQVLGYDAAFGFTRIHDQPFYFFERDGKVRISYGGRTLPFVYDQVFHNQCCEAAIHNVEILADVVLFHARWDGTWYLVEAGVYEGEMAGTYRYTAPVGWSFRYPSHWDRLDEELGFVQDTVTGKTVTFASQATTEAELERWLESEIDRKLAATEAENKLAEPLAAVEMGTLTIYRYTILSRREASETLLRTTVFFDGQRRYEFYAASPPVAEEEYEAILDSFRPASSSTSLVLHSDGS
jgi:Tol biopolymer transport system component